MKNPEYLIKIKGVQKTAEDSDEVELVTVGNFFRRDDSYIISYEESEATGFGDCHTVLQYDEGARRVTLSRTGKVNSELVIEQGKRHQCNYDTGYGGMVIGVSGERIESSLTDAGGDISFGYALDINAALASENMVYISVNDGGKKK